MSLRPVFSFELLWAALLPLRPARAASECVALVIGCSDSRLASDLPGPANDACGPSDAPARIG